jgi:hypothetical protein
MRRLPLVTRGASHRLSTRRSLLPAPAAAVMAYQQSAGFSAKAAELTNEKSSKRSARGTPRFQTVRNVLQMMAMVGCAGLGMYLLRLAYFHFRPEGNDKAIVNRMQDEFRLRPHWSCALVYAVAHHALANEKTPFGSPLLAPKAFESELRDVLAMLRELQLDYPGTSLPDLWAASSTYAVASLGGPLVPILWGRMEETFPADPIRVVEPKISSLTSSVADIKRLLAGQCELAPEEIVAIIGHRTLGCHGGAWGRHQLDSLRSASKEMLETRRFIVHETTPTEAQPALSSTSPGMFDCDYFVTLLKDKWEPIAPKGKSWFGSSKGGASSNGALSEPPMDTTSATVLQTYASPEVPNVLMQPLDMALKRDLQFLSWVNKFSENEIRFFNVYSKACSKIVRMGWEGTSLRE